MDQSKALWLANNLPIKLLDHLHLNHPLRPPTKPSFKLGTVAQSTIALSALSAAYCHQLRTGNSQSVSVDARHAVLEFKSWYQLNHQLPDGSLFDDIAGLYKSKDNAFVRIHTNFPHHKQGILSMLRCASTRASAQAALLQWNAEDFETAASALGLCATAARTFSQWDVHPHAHALRGIPPVQLVKIADAPKRESNGLQTRPLEGIRVLDLTRVLAGPVAGRTLAAHGADVLLVTSPNLPALPFIDRETSRGKRTTQLDLNNQADRQKLVELAKDADVFLQAYRPGGLSEKGFGPQDLAALRPGIVYASLTAYGWEGPWKDRRGFDSLVQNATGFGYAEGEAYASFTGSEGPVMPRPLPLQAIDHAAGYLLAFGINTALCKTMTDGGGWEVRVSLAAVAQWIRSLGLLDAHKGFGEGVEMPTRTAPLGSELAGLSREMKQRKGGTMTAIRHAGVMSVTGVVEGEAPMVLDADEARW